MSAARAAAAIAALCLLGAGCGGSSAGAVSSPGSTVSSPAAPTRSLAPVELTRAQQASAYLRAVAPANAAIDAFNQKTDADPPQAELAAAGQRAAVVLDQVRENLARITFTGAATADVRQVIMADAQVSSDLRGIGSQDAFSMQTFVNEFGRDAAALGAAVTLVRADLGLLPAS